MQSLTVIRCGSSPRMETLLRCLNLDETGGAQGNTLLFTVALDRLGPSEEYVRLLRRVRDGDFSGCLAGVLVIGETELDTKAAGRELIFHLNRRGCAFPERPLVEATGSIHNLEVLRRKLGLASREEALLAAARGLLDRLSSFSPPTFAKPRLLVLHASERKTSNTIGLGDLVLQALDPRVEVQMRSLRNGSIEDCRGCSYTVCSHFAGKGSCFYGGSIAQEVMPAVRDCNALLLLMPNYNDSVGANVMAFMNRLTSLHVNNSLSGRRLYGIVVSGYSGGDLVAAQALGALCLNKSFLLPPRFCMLETANDPGEILLQPGILERAAAFAAAISGDLLPPEPPV